MGKLFAKYLPVEGDIGIKDKWCQTLDGNKKMKLFLCSKDIQVGDKVRGLGMTDFVLSRKEWEVIDKYEIEKSHSYDNGRLLKDVVAGTKTIQLPTTYVATLKNGQEQQSIQEKDLFKVIGEISPDAVWVKEGDEFDEYEKWWWSGDYHQPVMNYIDGDDNKEWSNKLKTMIKLKCSNCKTFH